MESWLHWLLAGAWIYAILRIEKVAYDLKKLELSQQFSYGDEGLNVRAMSIATEDWRVRTTFTSQCPMGRGYTGQQCSICGKFNSAESVLRPKIDHPGVDR